MLVKSVKEASHLYDLCKTFNTIRLHDMKLNPHKCVFGVASGKFLGFMVLQCGVEANPNKVWAIVEMAPPKNVKEVQSLNNRTATFNRFVSKAMDKCFPFFKVLQKASEWIDECQKAFEELKTFLTSPPLLSPSKSGEELSLYLVVSQTTVSSTLVLKED
ncbi:putative mitochondrial protein AtMg00860 [Castanea sativa]|uniref:putative mitochondrial protein AtMg00860 n=1 Tax=Castanea sativa TaxID=21020 RepID=UPI003F653929